MCCFYFEQLGSYFLTVHNLQKLNLIILEELLVKRSILTGFYPVLLTCITPSCLFS